MAARSPRTSSSIAPRRAACGAPNLLVDGQDAVAGNVSWSVEDFVPQRLRVQIEASEAVLRARPIAADQRAGRLPLWRAGLRPRGGRRRPADDRSERRSRISPTTRSAAPTRASTSNSSSCRGTVTDGTGRARSFRCSLPSEPETSLPLRARMLASVADPGGRVVRESFTVPVRLSNVYLGLAPQFENRRAGAGERVAYDVIALNADGRRVARARRAMAARARGLELRLVSRQRRMALAAHRARHSRRWRDR